MNRPINVLKIAQNFDILSADGQKAAQSMMEGCLKTTLGGLFRSKIRQNNRFSGKLGDYPKLSQIVPNCPGLSRIKSEKIVKNGYKEFKTVAFANKTRYTG
jgi:hypothetical protein